MAAPSAQPGREKVLSCINSDRTTNRNMHTKIFAHFQANLHVKFWFPIKEQEKLVHFPVVKGKAWKQEFLMNIQK